MASSTSNSSPPPADQAPNWLELHPDLMATILQRVRLIDLLKNAQRVCLTWRRICQNPEMWRTVDMLDVWDSECDAEKLCMHIVDLSDCGLVDISIGCFATDKLLDYISYGSMGLRRLTLLCCCEISSEGLCAAVKNLPFLEELHLSNTEISKETIVVAGRYCPLLKTFKLNYRASREDPQIECDDEALAIAENMPKICHLQLFGNKMTNEGLRAILDNCSHLESLDIRRCFNVVLEGELGKRCSQQIKDFRHPNDPNKKY